MPTMNEIQKKINKVHAGALMTLEDQVMDVERIPSGVLALDDILSGGFAVGQWVELYGRPGGGKTSISMQFLGEAQKRGKCLLIDLEGALDPHVAETSGVNLNELWFAQPDTAERTFELMEEVSVADDLVAIVVDSVAGLTPRAEIEGDFGDSHVGLVARLLSQATRKLGTEMIRRQQSDVIIIWVNQIREKIGSMGYGPQSESTGGNALKFWCSTRLEVARIGAVKQGEDIIGQTVKVKSVKHRSGAPYKTATFDILYETGVSNESTLLDLAVDAGLVERGGAWYTFKTTGEKVQGKPAALDCLRADDTLFNSLMEAIRA
jgi:recombination protein RecA